MHAIESRTQHGGEIASRGGQAGPPPATGPARDRRRSSRSEGLADPCPGPPETSGEEDRQDLPGRPTALEVGAAEAEHVCSVRRAGQHACAPIMNMHRGPARWASRGPVGIWFVEATLVGDEIVNVLGDQRAALPCAIPKLERGSEGVCPGV
jgi:hypothetical protein